MIVQTRRREDIARIARDQMETRLKSVVTAYARLFPVPLKEINISLHDGVTIQCVAEEKKL
jgi:hypothetical protein